MLHSHLFTPKPLALLVAVACSLPMATIAEDLSANETEAVANETEVVEVWGTAITNSSSLLTSDIESKQADHLSDLLRDQPGIDIGGSHSIVQGVNIRGVDELDLNITIDGVTQNNNMFHHSGNLLINADILKAVDINVGTNSVLTGGLSGGVNFETKDAKELLRSGEKFGARIYANYGSNDYYSSSATVYSQLADTFDMLAYFTYTDKDNFKAGNGEEVPGNEGKVKNGMAKVGWDINPSNRLEVTYDVYNDSGDYYMRANFGGNWNDNRGSSTSDTEYERETFALNYELDLGDRINLRSTIYRNEINYAPSDTSGNSVHTGIKTLAESKLELASMQHHLRYGFEGNEQESKRIADGVTEKAEKATSYAVYIEDEIAITESLFVTPGVRYNHHNVEMNSSVDNLDKTFTDFTFGLAAKYLLNDQWTTRISSTQLFKGPALRETFTDYDSTFDRNMKAETGLNSEIGLAFEDQNIIGLDQLGFSVSVFQTNIDDYIDDWSVGKGERGSTVPGNYTNVGDYKIRGFESSLHLAKDAITASLSYAHSDSENKETGNALRFEVGDSIALNLGYELASWDLSLNWTSMVSFDLNADTEEDTDKEGYDVHNISARWLPMSVDGLAITASVENLFDELYYSQASYTGGTINDLESGRNIKLSASYEF